MTLLDVLRHQWHRRVRSPTFGRSLIGTLVLVLAAAYFGFLFVAAGWYYPQVVAEVAPEEEPLRLLNEFLLYGAVGLVPMRFFLQRSAGSDVRPYRALPVPTGRLVRALQAVSALSLFNVLPILPLVALWTSTVLPATSLAGATLWAGGVLLALAATEHANTLLRVAWDRNAALVVGDGAVLVAGLVLIPAVGVGELQGVSAWAFGGLSAGRMIPFIVLLVGTGVIAVAAHWALRARLYDVLDQSEPTSSGAVRLTALGRGRGTVLSLALLDAKLILRNKRPQQMLLSALLLEALFAFQVVTTTGGEPPPPVLDAFITVVFSLMLTGLLGFQYGGFTYAWHGAHFDVLLARAVCPRTLVRSQYATFCVLCVAGTAVVLPVVGALSPSMIAPLGTLLLYNLGMVSPFLLGLGAWSREAVALDQSAFFNYQGNTTATFASGFLGMLAVMALPVGLWVVLGRTGTLASVAALGALGIALSPFWTRGLGRLLHGQRHAMAAGFRNRG